MEHVEIYKRKIETEERRLEELDRQSKIMNVKILESQVHCGGKDANKIQDMKTAKQIRILENRLDHALVRFNDALAVNKLLREEIDHLRSERVVFDNINSKLAKELQDKKKEMALIIEQSNIAYEARDQANSEMALLKAQADKEQVLPHRTIAPVPQVPSHRILASRPPPPQTHTRTL
jgi:coiled-coil domain-containing protein 63/114